MSSRAVTTENNQYLCKTEESKATGMETVSTSLEETMIYANSDLDTSKDTVEYCEEPDCEFDSVFSDSDLLFISMTSLSPLLSKSLSSVIELLFVSIIANV
jgi:hypothetical protein